MILYPFPKSMVCSHTTHLHLWCDYAPPTHICAVLMYHRPTSVLFCTTHPHLCCSVPPNHICGVVRIHTDAATFGLGC